MCFAAAPLAETCRPPDRLRGSGPARPIASSTWASASRGRSGHSRSLSETFDGGRFRAMRCALAAAANYTILVDDTAGCWSPWGKNHRKEAMSRSHRLLRLAALVAVLAYAAPVP